MLKPTARTGEVTQRLRIFNWGSFSSQSSRYTFHNHLKSSSTKSKTLFWPPPSTCLASHRHTGKHINKMTINLKGKEKAFAHKLPARGGNEGIPTPAGSAVDPRGSAARDWKGSPNIAPQRHTLVFGRNSSVSQRH